MKNDRDKVTWPCLLRKLPKSCHPVLVYIILAAIYRCKWVGILSLCSDKPCALLKLTSWVLILWKKHWISIELLLELSAQIALMCGWARRQITCSKMWMAMREWKQNAHLRSFEREGNLPGNSYTWVSLIPESIWLRDYWKTHILKITTSYRSWTHMTVIESQRPDVYQVLSGVEWDRSIWEHGNRFIS